MRIDFKRIEIHNFKSFADESFDFDKQNGLNLICGKNKDIPGLANGAGKSCLGGALIFSLFGQTQEDIKNANIANKYVDDKEMRVVTYFDIEDKHYKVASGQNKYGGMYCQLYEIADGEEIDLTKSTMTETRKYLEKEILHCDLSIFLRTVVLTSDQNYNFFRLKKWEKKQFIERLFDITVFGDMYFRIHKDVLDFDKTLLTKQNKIIMLNKNKDDYAARMKKHEDEKAAKLENLNTSLVGLKEKQTKLKEVHVKTNTEEVEKYEQAISKVNDAVRQLNGAIKQLETEQSKLDVQSHKLKTSKESKQKIIDKHAELLSKLCEKCQGIFSDYYSITSYKADIEKIAAQLNANDTKTAELDAKKKTYADKLPLCDDKLKQLEAKIKELTAEANKTSKALSVLDVQIANAEREISELESKDNPFSELQANNLVELQEATAELDKDTVKYNYLKFAETVVSQDTLRKFIIADLIGLLNNKIKSYLMKFGSKYDVVFDSDMNYTFYTEGGQYEYDNFSSGERARLMIAACFAFRDFMHIRNNFSSNILFLDEFIDGAIDSSAIESVLEILKEFTTLWNQNIFVISHRKEISNDVFDNIIQIVKSNNISTITYLES